MQNTQFDWYVRLETSQTNFINGIAIFTAKESYSGCLKLHKCVFNKLNVNGYDEVLIDHDAVKYILKLPK